MSYVQIWVHLVFATKNRAPLLSSNLRNDVKRHIIKNCEKKDIFLQSINGYTDHLHCLISLGKEQCISKVAQLIKGESAHWINNVKLFPEHFTWQDDYYAVSVSHSQIKKVMNYIKNQESHHAKKSFNEEEEELINKHGFQRMKD